MLGLAAGRRDHLRPGPGRPVRGPHRRACRRRGGAGQHRVRGERAGLPAGRGPRPRLVRGHRGRPRRGRRRQGARRFRPGRRRAGDPQRPGGPRRRTEPGGGLPPRAHPAHRRPAAGPLPRPGRAGGRWPRRRGGPVLPAGRRQRPAGLLPRPERDHRPCGVTPCPVRPEAASASAAGAAHRRGASTPPPGSRTPRATSVTAGHLDRSGHTERARAPGRHRCRCRGPACRGGRRCRFLSVSSWLLDHPSCIIDATVGRLRPDRRVAETDDIADQLGTFLETELADAERIVLVTHSQGGLVVQRFLARKLWNGEGAELAAGHAVRRGDQRPHGGRGSSRQLLGGAGGALPGVAGPRPLVRPLRRLPGGTGCALARRRRGRPAGRAPTRRRCGEGAQPGLPRALRRRVARIPGGPARRSPDRPVRLQPLSQRAPFGR
ncbi:hypothetical protein SGPA1_21760 [Streptomyces misionensis JCM 4497]